MSDIESRRLLLRPIPVEGLSALVSGDTAAAGRVMRAELPPPWFTDPDIAELRLRQMEADPAYAPWSMRTLVLKETNEAIGKINSHFPPQPFEHQGETGLMIELGYTVFPLWRRKGYAHEAVQALGAFAKAQGVTWLRLSISPQNTASLALARTLGAERIGSELDEIDGPEDVFLSRL